MITFFIRRFLTSALVVLISTFLMYILVAASIDPLADLRTSRSPNKAQLIANRIASSTSTSPSSSATSTGSREPRAASSATATSASTGGSTSPSPASCPGAIVTTLQLVTAATILAIFVGVAVGIVSALRQYTGFDYSITFLSFLLYSLPVFWVAVLAKTFLAIDLNNFLANPHLSLGG